MSARFFTPREANAAMAAQLRALADAVERGDHERGSVERRKIKPEDGGARFYRVRVEVEFLEDPRFG